MKKEELARLQEMIGQARQRGVIDEATVGKQETVVTIAGERFVMSSSRAADFLRTLLYLGEHHPDPTNKKAT